MKTCYKLQSFIQMPVIIIMGLYSDPDGLASCWVICLFIYPWGSTKNNEESIYRTGSRKWSLTSAGKDIWQDEQGPFWRLLSLPAGTRERTISEIATHTAQACTSQLRNLQNEGATPRIHGKGTLVTMVGEKAKAEPFHVSLQSSISPQNISMPGLTCRVPFLSWV